MNREHPLKLHDRRSAGKSSPAALPVDLTTKKSWEYQQIDIHSAGLWITNWRIPDRRFDELNNLLKEGWTIAQVFRLGNPDRGRDTIHVLLKRLLN